MSDKDYNSPEVAAWMSANPMTREDAERWFADAHACACLGAPTDMARTPDYRTTPCYCQIRSEQARRLLGDR